MGLLINGEWSDNWYDTKKSGGRFVRGEAHFRNWVTADGSAGPSGQPGFKAETSRYHLYISYACPWAHRTLIFRAIKGLESIITVDAVHPLMLEDGWSFETDFPGSTGDQVMGKRYLREIYLAAKPDMTGRATVPILWDKKQKTIVSNESSEIIRMFNSAFDQTGAIAGDYWPHHLREEIEVMNGQIYRTVNNGVYRAGFATTQSAYHEAVWELFATLDQLEERLNSHPYLVGQQLTEADWRLFTTLVRFDAVYFGHFKCNLRMLASYPALSAYVQRLYNHPGIAQTVRLDHIKTHYYASHRTINPTGIVPDGPRDPLGLGIKEDAHGHEISSMER